MAVFDDLCETYLLRAGWADAENALAVRLSVTEGCTNAIKQGAQGATGAEATLTFLWDESPPHAGLSVEITDPGPGLQLGGALPPYPDAMCHRQFPLGRVMDQQVVAVVESPWSVRVTAAEHEPDGGDGRVERFADLARLGRGGYGMLMMALCWDRVTYSTSPGGGTVLRMKGLKKGLPG